MQEKKPKKKTKMDLQSINPDQTPIAKLRQEGLDIVEKTPEKYWIYKPGYTKPFLPEYCEMAVEALAHGCSKLETASSMRLTMETFNRFMDEQTEFYEAVQYGIQLGQAWWEREGRLNLHNKNFNTALFFINMKNRYGWADKVENRTSVTISQEDALDKLDN